MLSKPYISYIKTDKLNTATTATATATDTIMWQLSLVVKALNTSTKLPYVEPG